MMVQTNPMRPELHLPKLWVCTKKPLASECILQCCRGMDGALGVCSNYPEPCGINVAYFPGPIKGLGDGQVRPSHLETGQGERE